MKSWQFWVGVLIGLLCIAWAASQVRWEEFREALRHGANYWYVIPIVAAYFAVMFLRAVRWRYILNQCGHVTLGHSWTAILICYMGNNIFPLRAGEFMRVFMIGKLEESVSYSSALATVVVERLFDFLSVLAMLAIVLTFVQFPAERLMVTVGGSQYDLEVLIHNLGIGTMAGTAVLIVFIVLLYVKTEFVLRVTGFFLKVLPERFREKILELLRTFADGLAILGKPKALFAVAGLSVAAWFTNLAPVWLTGLALDFNLSSLDCLFLMVAGAAAASIPGPPGFLGTFHAINQKAMTFLTGTTPGIGLLFAIILHAGYYVPVTIAGAIAARRAGYSLNQLREEASEAEADAEAAPHC